MPTPFRKESIPPPSRKDGRCCISVTLRPELLNDLKLFCTESDQPLSVVVRAAIEATIYEQEPAPSA